MTTNPSRRKSPLSAVLGISALYHDSAAALVVDGEVVAAAQEERFSRVKDDAGLPFEAVRYCLEEAGLTGADLDLVGYYEKPLLKFDRILETYLDRAPRGFRSFAKAMPEWLGAKLFLRKRLRDLVPGYPRRIAFLEHHESHAASAFLASPFERAAILTVDGVGEWATASYGVGEGSQLRLMATQSFPDSLGLLYSAFTAFCGFRVNSGEYKLMGLAPYGQPVFRDLILETLVSVREDGTVKLNQDYFDYAAGRSMTNRRFARLFGGAARRPEGDLTERELNLAASIQEVVNDVLLKLARHVREVTGEKKLCLAGGVALNCVANGRLIAEGVFDDVWVQPAAGDAGGAVGTALALSHTALGVARPAGRRWSAALGPSFRDDEIAERLTTLGATLTRHGRRLDSNVAALLEAGAVVGWFQGRMEFGPRALGNRSILADPRRPDMQRRINEKVKFRESFRPFAPAVLQDFAGEYFDFGALRGPLAIHHFMLATVQLAERQQLKPDDERAVGLEKLGVRRSTIPAVTHVDQSARVQVVDETSSPRFTKLLRAFFDRTGCPMFVNTSFNQRGEPIVCTPEDAFRCFLATGLDALAIGDCLLLKPDAASEFGAVLEAGDGAEVGHE